MILVLSFFLSGIAWTFGSCTVYDAQDTVSDRKAGIKNPVVRYDNHTRRFLAGAAGVHLILLALAGFAMEASLIYYLCACGGTGIVLYQMITQVDLQNPQSCLWWFKANVAGIGMTVSMGLGYECLVNYRS